ncbi:conserved hypothetical protein [Roseibium sp. TrichSKD4]|nr:conserved hypothetical protein [Roseibium sp. TrichSKD4]
MGKLNASKKGETEIAMDNALLATLAPLLESVAAQSGARSPRDKDRVKIALRAALVIYNIIQRTGRHHEHLLRQILRGLDVPKKIIDELVKNQTFKHQSSLPNDLYSSFSQVYALIADFSGFDGKPSIGDRFLQSVLEQEMINEERQYQEDLYSNQFREADKRKLRKDILKKLIGSLSFDQKEHFRRQLAV